IMFRDDNYHATIKGYLIILSLLAVVVIGVYLVVEQGNIDLLQQYEQQPQQEQETINPDKKNGSKSNSQKTASSTETNQLIPSVVQEVGPGVVKITTKKEEVIYDLFYYQQRQELTGEGSGVLLDQQGHIITNDHVVEGVDHIKVILANGQGEYQGQVVGRDAVTDLAVIKIKAEKELPVPKLGDSEQLKVGQMAIAIGNPYGFSNTVTTGVISAINRNLVTGAGIRLTDMIQTDAAINPGNSGGALLNSKGEVVGINTAIISDAQGLGFAIPINRVKEIAQQLINKGQIVRPWIGIYGGTVTTETAQKYNLEQPYGVLISKVVEASPAGEAGLKKDDIILKFEGQKIAGMRELKEMLKKYRVGDKIKVQVKRNQKTKEIELLLEKRPQKIKQ
ncbi:MAG: S1C family serine protease, partial [Bacillota bacterium]